MTSNIVEMFNDFKTEVEKQQFIEQQYKTIKSLMDKNKQLNEEVVHLKKLLLDSTSITVQQHEVSRIIVTPEEALIESQLNMIQGRAYLSELTLEDVKKLDLLLKNKRLNKEQSTTVQSESKTMDKDSYSATELMQIVSGDDKI